MKSEMLSELTATNMIKKLQLDLSELVLLAGENEDSLYTREKIMLDLCKILSESEGNFVMHDTIKYWTEEMDAMKKRSGVGETS